METTECNSIAMEPGSAGCTLADHWSANSRNTGLPLEAGPKDDRIGLYLRDSENRRASRRDRSRNQNSYAQACRSNAPEFFYSGRQKRSVAKVVVI